MTTNTTNDNEPVVATDQAMPSETVPVAVAPQTELEGRVATHRAALIAKLMALKTDTGIEAAKARDQLKARLSQLGHIVKEGIVDGWANVGEAAKAKLDHWFAEQS